MLQIGPAARPVVRKPRGNSDESSCGKHGCTYKSAAPAMLGGWLCVRTGWERERERETEKKRNATCSKSGHLSTLTNAQACCLMAVWEATHEAFFFEPVEMNLAQLCGFVFGKKPHAPHLQTQCSRHQKISDLMTRSVFSHCGSVVFCFASMRFGVAGSTPRVVVPQSSTQVSQRRVESMHQGARASRGGGCYIQLLWAVAMGGCYGWLLSMHQ